MGPDARAQAGAAVGRRAAVGLAFVSALGATPPRAAADPMLELPEVGRGALLGACGGAPSPAAAPPGAPPPSVTHSRRDDPPTARLAATAEIAAVALLGARPRGDGAATADDGVVLPEVGALTTDRPELLRARAGLVAAPPCRALAAAVRVDLAELARQGADALDGRPLARVDRVLDDAFVRWAPSRWAALWLGRQKVPWSRTRLLEPARQLGVVPPAVVERRAPERRWGLALSGDLGAIGYAAGVFADAGRLEAGGPGAPPGRPDGDHPGEAFGPALFAAHAEWTPRAPVARDDIASAPGDPWRPVPRFSGGGGAIVRLGDDGRVRRVDLAGSGHGVLGPLAATFEVLLAIEDGEVSPGAVVELSALLGARVAAFGRAELDREVDAGSAGGGLAWFATADRGTRAILHGFADHRGGPPSTAELVVLLGVQAVL